MNEQAGRDMLIGWKKDREERDIYKAAAEESDKKMAELKDVVTEEFANIKAANEADRKQWKKELFKAKAPGIGIFAGVGYTSQGSIDGVVGFGLVWKLW